MQGVSVINVFNAEVIAASGTTWSKPIPLWPGFHAHSFDGVITGDGDLTITAYVTAYNNEVLDSTVVSAYTKTSGPETDGKFRKSLAIRAGTSIRFKVVNSDGVNDATITSDFCQTAGGRI